MIEKSKKIFKAKTFIGLLLFVLLAITSFITYKVIADVPVEVVKVDMNISSGAYATLYSNGELYCWGYDIQNKKLENIKDFVYLSYYYIVGIDSNNSLYKYSLNEYTTEQNIKLSDNVKFLDKTGDVAFYLTEDNKLYAYDAEWHYASQILSSFEKIDENVYLIMDDVKDIKTFNNFILIRDNNNNLYALGQNYFGKKINSGTYLTDITKILENVIEYDENYAITSNNDLYIFSSELPKPAIIKNNVKSVTYNENLSVAYTDINDVNYVIDYIIENDNIVIRNNYDNLDGQFKSLYNNESGNVYLLDKSLYVYTWDYYNSTGTNTKIFNNIKKMEDSYVLTDDGIFYTLTDPKNISGLQNVNQVLVKSNISKITENVKDFLILNDSIVLLIMSDNTIMALGYSNQYNDLFNDNSIINPGIPVLIKDLPNVVQPIKVYDIQLSTSEKIEFTVGEVVDYYVNIFPYNSIDKSVIWESSNEEVATVNSEGIITAISPGTAIITVKTSDGKISRSQEINVYPKVNSIEILDGDNFDIEVYERVILTAKVFPDDTLEKGIEWTISDSDNAELYKSYYDDKLNQTIHLDNNQIVVNVYAGGSYTVTATTENGLYSDSITLNTVEKVSNINLDIADEYYDGVNNAFIYMSESPTLNIGYKIYPLTATNQNVTWSSSDESIATVDSTGKITAYKTGRARITISSVDGGATRTFNVLVYDYSSSNVITGDVNGDNEVDILDLIRLRRYLAGLEESLQ